MARGGSPAARDRDWDQRGRREAVASSVLRPTLTKTFSSPLRNEAGFTATPIAQLTSRGMGVQSVLLWLRQLDFILCMYYRLFNSSRKQKQKICVYLHIHVIYIIASYV